MQTLLVVFSALSAFGLGVTIIDMFGVFEQLGQDTGDNDTDTDGNDDAADDGSTGETDGSTDSAQDDSAADDADSAHQADAAGSHSAAHQPGQSLLVYERQSALSRTRQTAELGTRAVAKALGALRGTVYFSLGAGPTGLFGILTGQSLPSVLGWSAGAGIFITVIAKLLRRFMRKDLDSSIKPEEYLMDKAIISVPILPGQIGKALVRRYDREIELYVKAKDTATAIAKGREVRIIDMNDEVYFVEEE